MKKLITLGIFLLCSVITKAQKIGGFGFVTVGLSSFSNAKLENRLQEDALLGNEFTFNSQGTNAGIRVFGLYKKILIGAGGYTATFTGGTEVGGVTLKVSGRFINVGYLVLEKPRTKVYAFTGVGGRGGSLTITRNEWIVARTISFGPSQTVRISEEVNQRGTGFELGAGVHRLFTGKNDNEVVKSGFLLGLVVKANFFPSTKWEFKTNGSSVANMGSINSFHIGITIGGGGFSN